MASQSNHAHPLDRQHFIATNVANTYSDLLNTSTVTNINTLPLDVAEDMAAEIELQMQKMQSLKALLEVRIRAAKREEDQRKESTLDVAWGELMRIRNDLARR